MREIFKSGSVGGAPGNRCFYLEGDFHPLLFAGFYRRFRYVPFVIFKVYPLATLDEVGKMIQGIFKE
jgi:hypothetical protein